MVTAARLRNNAGNTRDAESRPGDNTAGGRVRNALDAVAAANPRENVHYDKQMGAAVHSDTSKEFARSQANFHKLVGERYGQIGEAEGSLSSQYGTALDQLNAAKSSAMKDIPKPVNLDQAYKRWVDEGDEFVVMTGKGQGNEGEAEARLRVPKAFSSEYAKILTEHGYPVYENKIYISGRGAELYDAHTQVMAKAQEKFYEEVGPALAQQNQQIGQAQSTIGSQYSQALTSLNDQRAAATGTIQGAKASLQMQVEENERAIQEIRTSYQSRISSLNNTLSSLQVGGQPARSQSAAVQPRQINAQVTGPAAQGVSGGFQQK